MASLRSPTVVPGEPDDEEFARIVRFAPLVSIDLIIRDPDRKVLVALRNNEPARGFYFVPGGRIRKGELLEDAFARILEAETGCRAGIRDSRLFGIYQHLYPNNAFGHPGYGTHYVVLAYELDLNYRPNIVLDAQHSAFKWMDEGELARAPDVHRYTAAYFVTGSERREDR